MIDKELIAKRIIKNLNKKGFTLKRSNDEFLVWNYKIHYSDFEIKLRLIEKEDKLFVKYISNSFVQNLKNKKTSVKYPYCYTKIYENLIDAKEQFDMEAENIKKSTDTKQKYCLELEKYYKRKYDHVSLNAGIHTNGEVYITINCTDFDYKNSNNYSINYIDGNYYLKSHSQTLFKEIDTLTL